MGFMTSKKTVIDIPFALQRSLKQTADEAFKYDFIL